MADVGVDLQAKCGKCGIVWHVVVAKVGAQIARVECKECGAQHRYRSVTSAETKRGTSSEKTKKRATSKAKSSTKKSSSSIRQPLIEADMTKPLRSYRMTESYEAGDRITHRLFGEGFVELVLNKQKVQVLFGGERKILVQDYHT